MTQTFAIVESEYKVSRPYPELLDELRQSLLLIEPTDLGAGVRHTRNKILKSL